MSGALVPEGVKTLVIFCTNVINNIKDKGMASRDKAAPLGSYHPSSPISGWRLGQAGIRIPIRKVEATFLLGF